MQFQLIQVFDQPEIGFKGNTSTVVFLENPLSEKQMQSIAADQLQPATTFLWKAKNEGEYNVRWFAPDAEIGLCGHGTMASVAFLKNVFGKTDKTRLHYNGGNIEVECISDSSGRITLAQIPVMEEIEIPQSIKDGLGIPVKAMYATGNKHLILAESEDAVRNMKPNFSKLRESEIFGYAVTAAGSDVDFVSRTLVPHVHQLEDPATGSSHAALFPFWGNRLNKTEMRALQLSARGGSFKGSLIGENVQLEGHFKTLAEGKITNI